MPQSILREEKKMNVKDANISGGGSYGTSRCDCVHYCMSDSKNYLYFKFPVHIVEKINNDAQSK